MNLRSGQQGAIFLAVVLVLAVAGSAFSLGVLNNRQSAEIARNKELNLQMDLAKEALLAYVWYSYRDFSTFPGLLPCPDFDNDGDSDSNCNPSTMNRVGRLPQYVELPYNASNGQPARFYLNNAYATIDQQFWYAVSPNFVHTSTGPLSANGFQAGTLTLDGEDDIVALIIAPGESLGQNRSDNPLDYAQYLEGGNGASSAFWTAYAANPEAFNDSVVAIERSDIRDKTVYEFVGESIVDFLHTYRGSCTYYPRSWRSQSCSINFSLSTSALAFRNAVNTHASAPTWMRETASGGYNWISVGGTAATSAVTYTYTSANVASFDLRYTADPDDITDTGCLRFALSYDNLTSTGSHTQTSC